MANIENFLFCILKVSTTLHFKRMPGGVASVVPILSLSSWAVPQGRAPTSPPPDPYQALSSPASQAPGLPSLWSAEESSGHFGTGCPCWHLMPQLWPHALATQTFFALTLNFPAAKDLLPTEHIAILFCSQVNSITPPPPAHQLGEHPAPVLKELAELGHVSGGKQM